jgi:ABC-2 type transport system ATP-binding protein
MTSAGELNCNGISKKFSNGKVALSTVSFTTPTSGIFTLIGRNGAGKTTLTRILATLLEPSSGRATINGLDVMRDAKKLREMIAVVPQEGRTVSWMNPRQTISSYLLWRGVGYSESRKLADEAMLKVGIETYAHRMNSTLSGGIKRKVLVAMALASDAQIIFLDEPTTGLDPISRRQLWDVLTELGEKRFVFLTTHYLEEAEAVSNRIAILNDGRLLSIGTMQELRNQLKYRYTLRISNRDAKLGSFEGERFVRKDGELQIMTTEEEAIRISRELVDQKTAFSLNPVDLDDVFYYIVSEDESRPEAKKT